MDFQELISDFATRHGIGNLAAEDNVAALDVDGIVVTLAFIAVYTCGIENFGVPITAPFAPIVREDLKDTFTLGYLSEMEYRPMSFKQKNKRRFEPTNIKK